MIPIVSRLSEFVAPHPFLKMHCEMIGWHEKVREDSEDEYVRVTSASTSLACSRLFNFCCNRDKGLETDIFEKLVTLAETLGVVVCSRFSILTWLSGLACGKDVPRQKVDATILRTVYRLSDSMPVRHCLFSMV